MYVTLDVVASGASQELHGVAKPADDTRSIAKAAVAAQVVKGAGRRGRGRGRGWAR